MNDKSTSYVDGVPVVDFDQTFPVMVDHDGGGRDHPIAQGDVGPQVNSVLRDLLGWRPRVEDPKAFVDALTASFRLTTVQGHVEAQFVPRGYAVQADLGAVSGGQASLYRRAVVLRTEMLRILEGLTPLRTDADVQDMEAYRNMVRGAVTQVVDELGTAGGPRVEVVDNYFVSLTGTAKPAPCTTPDTVVGQLGALRDRFGLIDVNVNTPEEEGVRTSFWTLVDMLVDLQTAWHAQRVHFTGGAGQGFIGTELILLSRLMEATADQVDEVETLLDSVLITKSERRTMIIIPDTQLTLDGLLLWMRQFLTHEGRRIAEETGRDGIVAALTPTLLKIQDTFKKFACWITPPTGQAHSSASKPPLPPGLQAARVRIAVQSTSRLLQELVNAARRIGRFPAVVLTNVVISKVDRRDPIFQVEVRGFNLRPTYIPVFVRWCFPPGTAIEELPPESFIYPLTDSATADDDSLVALFNINDVYDIVKDDPQNLFERFLPKAFEIFDSAGAASKHGANKSWSVNLPAEDLPIAIVDGELGTVIYAPEPVTRPALGRAREPLDWTKDPSKRWDGIPRKERFSNVPTCPPSEIPDPTEYSTHREEQTRDGHNTPEPASAQDVDLRRPVDQHQDSATPGSRSPQKRTQAKKATVNKPSARGSARR